MTYESVRYAVTIRRNDGASVAIDAIRARVVAPGPRSRSLSSIADFVDQFIQAERTRLSLKPGDALPQVLKNRRSCLVAALRLTGHTDAAPATLLADVSLHALLTQLDRDAAAEPHRRLIDLRSAMRWWSARFEEHTHFPADAGALNGGSSP